MSCVPSFVAFPWEPGKGILFFWLSFPKTQRIYNQKVFSLAFCCHGNDRRGSAFSSSFHKSASSCTEPVSLTLSNVWFSSGYGFCPSLSQTQGFWFSIFFNKISGIFASLNLYSNSWSFSTFIVCICLGPEQLFPPVQTFWRNGKEHHTWIWFQLLFSPSFPHPLCCKNPFRMQVGPTLIEYAWIEIGLHPKSSQNHTHISHVLISSLNSKFG